MKFKLPNFLKSLGFGAAKKVIKGEELTVKDIKDIAKESAVTEVLERNKRLADELRSND